MTPATIQALVINEASASQVIKLPAFKGSLPTRALYIYTPPGYNDNLSSYYPVIYMHDGQNVFESFVKDSYAGSWRADETADQLIREGKMRPCIIVGVSNGREHRLQEYQPPHTKMRYSPLTKRGKPRKRSLVIEGHADKTFAYYQEIAAYLKKHYRILSSREHTATCGSSMGALFTTYIAWQYPEFAKHHAALSPSYWTTETEDGKLSILESIQSYPKRDIRLWLDSGEGSGESEGADDDNKFCTLKARQALLAAGYQEGIDFVYYLAKGAPHREYAWAARLAKIFSFLMPA